MMLRFVLVSALALPTIGAAGTIYVNIFAYAMTEVGGNAIQQSASPSYSDSALMNSPQCFSVSAVSGHGSAQAYVCSQLGTLEAYSQSFFNHDNVNADAQARAGVEVLDYVYVNSTLPKGTPVTVNFMMPFHGVTPAPVPCCDPDTWYDDFYLRVENYNEIPTYLSLQSTDVSGAGVLSGSVTVKVGDELRLYYGLDVREYVHGKSNFADTLTMDYAHTVGLYAGGASGNPDVTLESTTGYTYASSPEPSGALLGGIGVAALALVRRFLS